LPACAALLLRAPQLRRATKRKNASLMAGVFLAQISMRFPL